jgi:TolA-binding protein
MSIFDSIEKLITEHGSAAILNQQLAFARDQFSDLESKVETLRTENADLKAQLQRESLDHKKIREELQRLQKEHSEEIRVHRGIEFRRGKRTGGVWVAFCPVCHTPADTTTLVMCANQKCKWRLIVPGSDIPKYISEFDHAA